MQEYAARLAGVFPADKVPEPYQGFVTHRAFIEGREIEGHEEVAVLAISGTTSFFVVFMDSLDLEKLREDLGRQRAFLPEEEAQTLVEASRQ